MAQCTTPSRRDILSSGISGIAAVIGTGCSGAVHLRTIPRASTFAVGPVDPVRIGFVGIGSMGTAHVRNLLRIKGCEILAVCDIIPDRVNNAQNLVEDAGFPRPVGYVRGEYDFLRLCDRDDLDLVYTATPWRWHVPVCTAAMERGKHAATEIPVAVTLDGCWQLVETAERTGRHCIMMENCCYGRTELMVLNMVRQGLLGDIIHAEGGYLHDLRAVKFSDEGEGLWRLDHSVSRDGNIYPTHGLGPIAQCMNINRGDRFTSMVSLSSRAQGLTEYALKELPVNDPRRELQFKLGDVNTSIITTERGCTLTVVHDCNLPRPYSRINLVQGSKGIFSGYPDRIYIEGRSPDHEWEDADAYRDEFEHPLWRRLGGDADGAGHGGMDFIEDWRLIECLRRGLPLDMDVYDAAAWSAVAPLSEQSVAAGGESVGFPDFTRGQWQNNPPLGIVGG